ncbi:MFS transporter [Streptomyces sp. NPDC001970]
MLGSEPFARLFVAHATSQLGFRVAQTAMPLTALTAADASPSGAAALITVQTCGFLLIGLPAGAWVDRWPRTTVLLTADAVRCAAAGYVGAVWLFSGPQGSVGMGQLCAAALVLGIASVFFDVAAQSAVPQLLGPERLVAGNARLQAAESAAAVAGPLVAGALAVVAAPAGLVLSAVAYGTSALVLLGNSPSPASAGSDHSGSGGRGTGIGRQVREGLRFLLGHPALRRIAVATGVFNFAWAVVAALMLALLVHEAGESETVAGAVMAGLGAGGVIGALLVKRFLGALGQARAITYGLLVPAPFVLLASLAGRTPAWTTGLGMLGVGAGAVLYNVTQVSLRQTVTPPELLGRVNATMRTLVWGMIPLGGVVASAMSSFLPVSSVVVIGAVLACTAWLWLVGLPSPARSEAATRSG